MKKLMTTVSAVALAFGLYATDTGTSFEGLTGDAPYDIYASTGELTAQAANQTYWVTNGTETLTVVAGTSDAANRPAPYEDATQTRYLNIKTTLGNPVTRNVSVGGAGTSIGTGFYFDSLVKFTAFDEDPAINLNGGKLAVWIKEVLDANDNPTATNLVVTAGFLDGQGGAIATNYTCTVSGVNLNDGGWHRVTVKAIADITNGGQVPGFVVYVDTVRATSGAEKGIVAADLSTYAYLLNSEGSLFPSAVQSGQDKDKIAAVAFDGQGDVDDLLFTDVAPDFAKDATFFSIYLGEHVTSVQGYDPDGNVFTIGGATNFVYGENKTVEILDWTCDTGWMKGSVTNEAGQAVSGSYTITDGGSITVNAKKLGATVTDAITGNPVGDGSYETLGDAVDAINALTANASVKITLNDAATSDIVLQNTEDANISVVLDLAGKNITGSGESAAAVVVASGSLLITNSTVEVGHVIAASGYPAVAAANADLTIAGGIYDGAIDVSGASSALITGGEFSVNANKDPNDENVPPAANADLKAAAAAAGNELVVGSGSASYYVVVEKVTTYTVTFVSGIAGQITNSYDNLAAGAEMPTPPDASIAGKTYVWSPEVASTVTGDATYTAVYSDINYTIKFVYGLNKEATNTVVKTYYESVSEPTGTAREGYTLAWSPAVSEWPITVTHDETYEATYTPIEYTITYKDNEGKAFVAADWASGYTAPTTFTVTAPATLPVAANIARDGVQFNGWTNSVGTTIAATTAGIYENLEIFANFTVLGPTYPSYINTSDAKITGQYDAWAAANSVPAGANNYEAAFLLNVAPGLVGATLNATDISISGTTVTIDINRGNLNGYVYVKKAATLAGLATAVASPVEVTPADGNSRENKIDNGGRITQTDSGATMFYQIGVQSTPVAVPNN